ncbi:alpha/beta hydrolase [Kineococcus sp. SYSU DK001]|uniref:alpha/beta hydrolase n=1 Tax=Kineococcus sp. SYSU DK001 TaxID=3383122 RepID=UPI003D7D76D7
MPAHLGDARLDGFAAESRAFYARRGTGRGPGSHEEVLALRARARAAAPVSPPTTVEVVRAGGRTVPVRVHVPARGPVTGVHLHLHGGGFYLGTTAGDDARHRALADASGLVVVGVDHRLAPEHPWPCGLEDCESAALWLADHAGERFGTRRLTIGGSSAGATLALGTLLRLRDRGLAPFGGAVLEFGTYDLSGCTPAGRRIAGEYFLQAYAGAVADRTDPDLSPVHADVSGLPPVLVVVGAEDVLLEDNLVMATRLAVAGVDVDVRVYPASPHGFTGHATSMAEAAREDVRSWLRQHPPSPPPPRGV